MTEVDDIRALLAQQRYKDAGRRLDDLLISQKDNDELWYLRGIVSLKMKSYDAAAEFFERALSLKRKAEYHRMKGMAHFEILEIEEAVEELLESLSLEPNDAVSHFFLAVCYMLLDDPLSAGHIKRAHELDPRKTRQMLSNFFSAFLQNDPRVSEAQKKIIGQRMKEI